MVSWGMSLDAALVSFLHGFTGVSSALDASIIFFAEYFPFLVGGALAVLLYRSGRSRIQQIHIFCVAVIAAVIARVGVVELIRVFYERPRPYVTLKLVPLISESSWSFPSGHAAFFFAFAAAIYQYNKHWGNWFFVAAISISLARIASGVHYPSDILGGALAGIIIGTLTVRFARRFERPSHTSVTHTVV